LQISIFVIIIGILVTALFTSPLIILESTGHRDGCHRWHSCPSDNGSYVCGDLGYNDECSSSNNDDDEDDKDSIRISSDDDDEDDDSRDDNDDSKEENDNDNSNSDDNPNRNNDDQNVDTALTNKSPILSDVCLGNTNCFTGTISKVIDGDTVDVDDKLRIRLALVNTPEIDVQGYNQAKDFVSSVCGVGTKVIVDEDDGQKTGSYGRMIGLVYCGEDKSLLNEMLIESGYAEISQGYCERSEFSGMIWAQDNGCN
jgi:endonuclease YncB( thermonuclease family)